MTLEEIQKLDNDQLRSIVAHICGFMNIKKLRTCSAHDGLVGRLLCPDMKTRTVHVPDYCNDLNAMHEAEKQMSTGEHSFYLRTLAGITTNNPDDLGIAVFATARQRAEAFVLTMEE
jgi:hypothetical protein